MEQAWQPVAGCAVPPALSELDLIAAIDDEADDSIMHHLYECPHCAARAQMFRELQQRLRTQLYRLFCPSADDLIAYQQGMLGGEPHDTIARHLATCPHCTREVGLVEQMVGFS